MSQGAPARGSWFYLGLGTFFLPLWLVIIYNLCVTAAVLLHARKALTTSSVDSPQDQQATAALRRLVARLQWYPLILIVCQLPATLARVYPFAVDREASSHGDTATQHFFGTEAYFYVSGQ